MDSTLLQTKKGCRLDDSHLFPILDLGELYLSDFIDPEKPKDIEKAPLELVMGAGTGLVQLRHTVNPERMFRDYWYRSGTNPAMVWHLAGIANRSLRYMPNPAVVCDIGSNDGSLLHQYDGTIDKIGFDPSNISSEGFLRVRDFFGANAYWSHMNKPADIVTSIAMFYDLDNPVEFVDNVKSVIAEDGLWIIELHYLPSMLSYTGFDAICHEHLTYYSLTTLTSVLRQGGFHIQDVELNNVNGGSMRVYARPFYVIPSPNVRMLYDMERLSNLAVLQTFAESVVDNKRRLRELLMDIHLAGQRIYGYGASTKGNTILQYVGLDNSIIEGIADRNPAKWGKVTAGTNIPVISEDEARQSAEYMLVLPYHFIDNFVEREQAWLARGGKFIVPCPYPYIVGG